MVVSAVLLPRFALSGLPFHRISTARRRLVSDFPGQNMPLSKNRMKNTFCARSSFIRMQLNKGSGSLSHDLIENGEHFLDDLSHWISKKVAQKVRPLLPENFDVLDWLPSGLHSRIHSVERAATVFVRECLLLGLFCFIFARVERFCHWLNRIHYSRTHKGQDPPGYHYRGSVYSAMEDPLRAGLLLWQLTHMLHVIGPLFKLRLSLLMIDKMRSIGFIIVVAWFLFKWKNVVLERFIAKNKADAPRFVALDKVLSLLMYYIVGSCIGEVSGIALRSVLAIGGISGIAVGLAAKEIVGNFLGGALLFVTRPFVVGDRVKAESFEGWVEDIDFLHTKLLGYDRSPVLVPNAAIVNEVIVNHSRAKCRQLVAVFLLRNEDVFLVDKITEEITDALSKHEMVDLEHGSKPICYLKSMSPEGLELELICSIQEKGSIAFYKAKQEILVKAAKIVNKSGACFETNASVLMMAKEGQAQIAEL